MRLTEKEIRELLEGWYEARTTAQQERALREWFRTAGTLPADLESSRRIFCGFEALAGECAAELRPLRNLRRGFVRRIAVWTAAAVVIAGIVVAAGYARCPYGYINGVPVRDVATAMETTAYFQQLETLDKAMNEFGKMMEQTQKEKL